MGLRPNTDTSYHIPGIRQLETCATHNPKFIAASGAANAIFLLYHCKCRHGTPHELLHPLTANQTTQLDRILASLLEKSPCGDGSRLSHLNGAATTWLSTNGF